MLNMVLLRMVKSLSNGLWGMTRDGVRVRLSAPQISVFSPSSLREAQQELLVLIKTAAGDRNTYYQIGEEQVREAHRGWEKSHAVAYITYEERTEGIENTRDAWPH